MIYTNYIPLIYEVNKIMYNYAILAVCRMNKAEKKIFHGNLHNKSQGYFGIFYAEQEETEKFYTSSSLKKGNSMVYTV